MFTDYWVIAQLLAQVSALALLLYASVFATQSLRYWVGESDSELQIQLERQNYLMSAIMQVGLWFQVLSLLMFLHTANEHLPPLIKGAMCATGTLGVNAWGYPLFILKCLAILVYAVYLFINYLDNQEPTYPLTPYKYIWLYPALLLATVDMYMLIQYFANIKPDLIATCCSVDFTAENRSQYGTGQASFRQVFWYSWVGSFSILFIGNSWNVWHKSRLFASFCFLLSVIYVGSALYELKYDYVRYMYGLPSHLCLFDIFWGKYYSVGYVLFGSYYAVLISALGVLVLSFYQKRLTVLPTRLAYRVRFGLFLGLFVSFGVPFAYWFGSGYVF
jgi:hypothetical protein